MQAGTKVKVRLLESKDSREVRRSRGIPDSCGETFEGQLVIDVKAGEVLWVDNSLRTTTIQAIDPVAPGVFDIKTQNSLYELTLV